jgi:hypothetical protein
MNESTVNKWLADCCRGLADFQLVLVQQKLLCTVQIFLGRLYSKQQYNNTTVPQNVTYIPAVYANVI